VHLDVSDPLIAENAGRFVLSVRDGAATVEPGGRGDVRCDVRGLAPLYTGMFRPAELSRMGWITGSAEAIAAAARVFAGPEPWMPEYF
jgi:predicted acetyltransferase